MCMHILISKKCTLINYSPYSTQYIPELNCSPPPSHPIIINLWEIYQDLNIMQSKSTAQSDKLTKMPKLSIAMPSHSQENCFNSSMIDLIWFKYVNVVICQYKSHCINCQQLKLILWQACCFQNSTISGWCSWNFTYYWLSTMIWYRDFFSSFSS